MEGATKDTGSGVSSMVSGLITCPRKTRSNLDCGRMESASNGSLSSRSIRLLRVATTLNYFSSREATRWFNRIQLLKSLLISMTGLMS